MGLFKRKRKDNERKYQIGMKKTRSGLMGKPRLLQLLCDKSQVYRQIRIFWLIIALFGSEKGLFNL